MLFANIWTYSPQGYSTISGCISIATGFFSGFFYIFNCEVLNHRNSYSDRMTEYLHQE